MQTDKSNQFLIAKQNAMESPSSWTLSVALACLCATLLVATGCQSTRWFKPAVPQPPIVIQSPVPTSAELVSMIRRNTEGIRQLNSNVKVVMDGMPASASGSLLMERPNRMRLKVGILGMTNSGIDIGSNADRFWIFNKSSFGGARPTVYYANHEEYAHSAMQQNFQLRPQWIFDAMGLIEFDPEERFDGPYAKGGFLELHSTIPTTTGNIIRILTVDSKTGVVLQQSIHDSNNRLLGWVRASKHRYYKEHQASLPQHIKLTTIAPDGQPVTLSVQIQSHMINSLYVDPDVTWSMPQPADVPLVDLTRLDPSMLQPFAKPPGSDSGQNPDSDPTDTRDKPFRMSKLRGFNLLSR